MWYFKCSNRGYGIKKKHSNITDKLFQCPICDKVHTIMRATPEEYKNCRIKDLW